MADRQAMALMGVASSALILLGNGSGVEQSKLVVKTPVVGPGLFAAAGHVKNELEDLLAHLLNRCLTGGDAPGIYIDQVGPPVCECAAGGNLDDRSHGKAVRSSAPGGEDMQVHPRG